MSTPNSTESVVIDFDEYDEAYQPSGSALYHNAFSLVQHGLLRSGVTEARILNVASGPVAAVERFLSHFLPICKEIVLVEVNPNYCREYRESDWFAANGGRIRVIEGDVTQIVDCDDHKDVLVPNSFDIIWCSHMFYYLRLKQIPRVFEAFDRLLLPFGFSVVSVVADSGVLSEKVMNSFTLERPYVLSHSIAKSLNEKAFPFCQMFDFDTYDDLTKEEFAQTFRLFVVAGLFQHPDYNASLKVSEEQSRNIDTVIHDALPHLLKKSRNWTPDNKLFAWRYLSTYFVVKKAVNARGMKGKRTKSKL